MIELNNQLKSGYKINNLLLMESNFMREAIVTFDESKVQRTVNVDVNVQISGNVILVTETLDYTQKFGENVEVIAKIKMLGMFEKNEETELALEDFGHINGAAILFPYMREHLSNLSSRAGLGLVILPPFNFTKQAEK
jgi:preprotein translocase subunit SecB